MVEVLTYERYQEMSTSELQDKLRYWHLVITGMPTEEVQFDESGLQVLTNWDSSVHMQGDFVLYLNACPLISFLVD